MDERQQQIRERAGLEESRLNVELIEFLRKWSTPALLAVAVAAAGFVGYQKLMVARAGKVNRAFADLEAASEVGQPSPDSLRAVAAASRGVRAVPLMARLAAADAYLESVRRGVVIGGMVKPDGGVEKSEFLLTSEQRTANLKDAEGLYREVLTEAGETPGYGLHALGAMFGLAAVAECRADLDGAKAQYEAIMRRAQEAGFPPLVAAAKERVESLPKIAEPVRMYLAAELPKLPWEIVKPPAPGDDQPLLPLPPGAVPAQPGADGVTPAPEGAAPKSEGGEPKPAGDQPAAAPAPAPAPDQPK